MVDVTIDEDTFGNTTDPISGENQIVKRFTFTNQNGLSVQVITYGATITSIRCPDKFGNIDDVVLGFDDVDGYRTITNPYFGATVGRVCNRIGDARFTLNGKVYKVDKNLFGRHQLHGGTIGFDKFNWSAHRFGATVVMSLVSPDQSQGYPGTVVATITYELLPDNTFVGKFAATSSEPTPINLTNHSYFNLAGHSKGHSELYNHIVMLNADRMTETDSQAIPTGILKTVSGTDYDLRVPRCLGDAIAKLTTSGYDDNFCVSRFDQSGVLFVARVEHPRSGRVLEVYSDQPGVQFYTGNFMPDPSNTIYLEGKKHEAAAPSDATEPIIGKGNTPYFKHGAFCLETQNYPDAVNHSNFPKSVLNPGEVYRHDFRYKFIVNKDF